MFDGGEEAPHAEKAGCEAANKCCFCFEIGCGLKVVAGLSWISTVGMIILAFAMSALSAVTSGASDISASLSKDSMSNMKMGSFTTNSLQLVQSMNLKSMDASTSLKDASSSILGFTIIALVAAVLQLIASILYSMWCCCGKSDLAKSSKHAYHAAICQTLSFAIFSISWFFMGEVVIWNNFIGCLIDTLFYVYIIFVAKRYHAQCQSFQVVEEVAVAEAAINE